MVLRSARKLGKKKKNRRNFRLCWETTGRVFCYITRRVYHVRTDDREREATRKCTRPATDGFFFIDLFRWIALKHNICVANRPFFGPLRPLYDSWTAAKVLWKSFRRDSEEEKKTHREQRQQPIRWKMFTSAPCEKKKTGPRDLWTAKVFFFWVENWLLFLTRTSREAFAYSNEGGRRKKCLNFT